ncbi:MAG: chorismate synthase [Deltaproteobacteria bacterium]|nr:MAG: chorismate synthase [Deltaproteobacteria bacterium]TNF24548.1 MAG: chorismate synthase [Deltaproteobacteria bacterium]
MRGNSFGKMLSITSFGESHGPGIGVVVDGVPPGLEFSLEELQNELDRRAPGQVKGTTSRKEPDTAEVLSGVFEGKTLGTPIAVFIRNTNQRSKDYDKLKEEYRPGHADETYMDKYGIRDHRGGGRSSGRETIARVIGGYFASLVIPKVKVKGFISKLGPFVHKDIPANLDTDFAPYGYPDASKNKDIEKYLVDLKKNGESRGGQARIIIDACPKGLGEPSFDKLKADFAKALMSIGAVVAYSYGLGEEFADIDGSVASSSRDNFGGIEGGISNGSRIILNVTFKPTSTVGEKAKEGRHDPCIIPRAIPVIESMVKLVLADHYLRQNAYSNGMWDE